jgi:phosphatidylinositol alpha-1,6-mannosyltransferase
MPARFIKEGGNIEGFGIVYLEANLYEKPVIGGKTGGIRDAIEDGKTGFIVNPENVNEISQALINLLTNKELSNKLGVQGRKRVLKYFDWDEQINRVKDLLS